MQRDSANEQYMQGRMPSCPRRVSLASVRTVTRGDVPMTYQASYGAAEPARTSLDTMSGLTLLEFGAPWCGHCIAAQPALQLALASRPGVRHIKVEDGRGLPLGRSFGVKLWPTLVVLRDGVELARAVRPRESHDLAALLAAMDR